MPLRATERLKVYRHPGADDETNEEVREDDFPIQGDRSRYLRPLETDGSEDDPDEFDVRDRLPLEFAGDSAQQAGRRARRIESDLADAYDGLTATDRTDTDNTEDTESES